METEGQHAALLQHSNSTHRRSLRRSVANAESLDLLNPALPTIVESPEVQLARALRLFAVHRDVWPFLAASRNVVAYQDDQGDTALHHAIAAGNFDIASDLTSLMTPQQLNLFNGVGETPLHVAIQSHAPGIINTLFARGASPMIPDAEGNTPCHLAVVANNPAVLRAIVEGCLVDERDRGQLFQHLERTNFEGDTALHFAVRASSLEMVQILTHGIEHIPDASRKTDLLTPQSRMTGRTPLHYAAMQGHTEIVAYLTSLVPEIVNVQDFAGNTPLHFVGDKNHPCAQALLAAGADITLFNHKKLDPFGNRPALDLIGSSASGESFSDADVYSNGEEESYDDQDDERDQDEDGEQDDDLTEDEEDTQ